MCFPVSFVKFFKNTFFYRTPSMVDFYIAKFLGKEKTTNYQYILSLKNAHFDIINLMLIYA